MQIFYIFFHRLLGNFLEAAKDLRTACKIDFDEQADEWLKEVTPNVSGATSNVLFCPDRRMWARFSLDHDDHDGHVVLRQLARHVVRQLLALQDEFLADGGQTLVRLKVLANEINGLELEHTHEGLVGPSWKGGGG